MQYNTLVANIANTIHNSGVMLYQLNYQGLGSMVVGRKVFVYNVSCYELSRGYNGKSIHD